MPKPSARSGLLVLILFVAAIAAATASSAPTPDFVLSDQHGHDFKLSRERIRQIQDEALGKLRAQIEERDHPFTEAAALAA